MVLVALNLRIAVSELPPVLRDLPITAFERSLLVTIPVLCFSLAAFAGPSLAARFGEERSILAACGALSVGLALRPWWPGIGLVVGTIACGMAVAVMNVLLPSVVRRRFPRRLGEMTAAYTMSLSIGAGMAAGLTVPIAQAFGGAIGPALTVWAVPAAAAFGLWSVQARDGRPTPAQAGRSFGLLRDRKAWLTTAYFGLQSALFYTLLSWLPTIYRDHGVSAATAGGVLAVMTAIGIVGNFSAPLLVTRLGSAQIVVVALGALTGLGLFGVLLFPDQLSLVWAALLGVGTAGTFSVTLLLIASRAQDAAIAARLSSMAQGIGYAISAAGPLVAGLLHAASSGWSLPIAVTLVVLGGQLAAGLGAARPGVISR